VTGKDLLTVDALPASDFVAEAIVIDFTEDSKKNPDRLMVVDDILNFEKQYGKIPARTWVVMRTGWGKYAQDAAKFFNIGADGMPHTPGPSKEAVEFLIKERDVLGFCTETVGTDAGIAATFDPPFPCHNLMQGAGKYGLTQLNNLDKLPPRGAVIIALPLKITGGSGSPVRPIAIVPK
jgi:kynurenine formamidase